MKKKLSILFILSIFSTGALPLFAQNAEQISQKHYKAMLADLETYIRDNPNATDLAEARDKAIESAYYAGEKDVILRLAEEKFDALKAQDPISAQDLAQTGMMLVQFSLEQGKTEIAQGVLETFQSLAKTGESDVYGQVAEMLEAQLNKPAVGTSPELSGTTLDGKAFSLEDYKGKVVMIDFWATWCGPCVAEMPNVKSVYAKYHEQGFEIIGISLDRSLDPLKSFIKENDVPWQMIYDADQSSSIADKFSITQIPSIFLLDKTGKIAAVNARGPELQKEVARLLGE